MAPFKVTIATLLSAVSLVGAAQDGLPISLPLPLSLPIPLPISKPTPGWGTSPLPTPTPYPTQCSAVTVTVTSTVSSACPTTPAPTPDTSCGNPGLQWAYYPNAPGGDATNAETAAYDPAFFKAQTPAVSGTTSAAGGLSGVCSDTAPTFSVYGNTEPCTNFTVDYRGYLYSNTTGNFTFDVTSADNLVFVWAGPDAYAGWTAANAIVHTTYGDLPAGGIAAPVPVTAGEYVPVRILFAQGGGPYGFAVQVTSPEGDVVLSSTSDTNPDLVRYSCDGTAPPYVPYGTET